MAIPSLASYCMPEAADYPVSKVSWPLHPGRAVLLVHDMQEYFVAFYGADSPFVERLKSNVAALQKWARQWAIPIVFTAQPTHQSVADRALLNDMWGPGLTAADPATQAIVAGLEPVQGDTMLVKWRYSAFQRSSLEELMRQWQRNQLVICGVYAHIGCMLTAADAFMRDIQPFMVGDALGDFSLDDHHMALKYVAGRCGRVISTHEITAMAPIQVGLPWLRAQVLAKVSDPAEDIGGDENLMDYGLDSVQVMSLVAEWNLLGLKLGFEDLAREPTLNGWLRVLEQAKRV